MKEKDEELYSYDHPHESGGNVKVTMTRRQAIDWQRKSKRLPIDRVWYPPDTPEETIFLDWVTVNWAYKEEKAP